MTGQWILDVNNAALTHYFNVHQRRWDPDLCAAYGLDGLLPEVEESGTPVGPLHGELARRWGLGPEVQVCLGGHDQGCSALGAGPPQERSITLATGTAWVLYCPLTRPTPDPDANIFMYCHAQPKMWALLVAYSGGNVLDTFIDRFCAEERRRLEAQGLSFYSQAISWEHLSEELIVIPFLFGHSSPENDPTATGAILGLAADHGPKHVIMGIVEAICFETRRNLELFKGLGLAPKRIKMMGGAGRSDIWPQMIADICSVEVDVLEVTETSALGAAFLAGRAIGEWSGEGLPQYPKARRINPDPERQAKFEEKYNRYLKALELERQRRRGTYPSPPTMAHSKATPQ
jgi:xylulokinase